jgi:hypothetical protein
MALHMGSPGSDERMEVLLVGDYRPGHQLSVVKSAPCAWLPARFRSSPGKAVDHGTRWLAGRHGETDGGLQGSRDRVESRAPAGAPGSAGSTSVLTIRDDEQHDCQVGGRAANFPLRESSTFKRGFPTCLQSQPFWRFSSWCPRGRGVLAGPYILASCSRTSTLTELVRTQVCQARGATSLKSRRLRG